MSFTEWWDGLSVANKTFGIIAAAIFVIALLCLIIGLFVSNNKYKKTSKTRNKENEKRKEQEQQKAVGKLQEQIERLKEEIKNVKDLKQPEVKQSKDYSNDLADLKVQNAKMEAKYDELLSTVRNQQQNPQIPHDPEIQDLKRQLEDTNKKLDEQQKSLSDLKTNQQQQPKEQPNPDVPKEPKDLNTINGQQPVQPAQQPINGYYPPVGYPAPQGMNPAIGGGYQPLAPMNGYYPPVGYPAPQGMNPAMGGGYPQPAATNPMFAGGYTPQFCPPVVGTMPAPIASQPIQPVVAAAPAVLGPASEIVQPVRRPFVERPAYDSYLDTPYSSSGAAYSHYPPRERYTPYYGPIGNNPTENNDNLKIDELKREINNLKNDLKNEQKTNIDNLKKELFANNNNMYPPYEGPNLNNFDLSDILNKENDPGKNVNEGGKKTFNLEILEQVGDEYDRICISWGNSAMRHFTEKYQSQKDATANDIIALDKIINQLNDLKSKLKTEAARCLHDKNENPVFAVDEADNDAYKKEYKYLLNEIDLQITTIEDMKKRAMPYLSPDEQRKYNQYKRNNPIIKYNINNNIPMLKNNVAITQCESTTKKINDYLNSGKTVNPALYEKMMTDVENAEKQLDNVQLNSVDPNIKTNIMNARKKLRLAQLNATDNFISNNTNGVDQRIVKESKYLINQLRLLNNQSKRIHPLQNVNENAGFALQSNTLIKKFDEIAKQIDNDRNLAGKLHNQYMLAFSNGKKIAQQLLGGAQQAEQAQLNSLEYHYKQLLKDNRNDLKQSLDSLRKTLDLVCPQLLDQNGRTRLAALKANVEHSRQQLSSLQPITTNGSVDDIKSMNDVNMMNNIQKKRIEPAKKNDPFAKFCERFENCNNQLKFSLDEKKKIDTYEILKLTIKIMALCKAYCQSCNQFHDEVQSTLKTAICEFVYGCAYNDLAEQGRRKIIDDTFDVCLAQLYSDKDPVTATREIINCMNNARLMHNQKAQVITMPTDEITSLNNIDSIIQKEINNILFANEFYPDRYNQIDLLVARKNFQVSADIRVPAVQLIQLDDDKDASAARPPIYLCYEQGDNEEENKIWLVSSGNNYEVKNIHFTDKEDGTGKLSIQYLSEEDHERSVNVTVDSSSSVSRAFRGLADAIHPSTSGNINATAFYRNVIQPLTSEQQIPVFWPKANISVDKDDGKIIFSNNNPQQQFTLNTDDYTLNGDDINSACYLPDEDMIVIVTCDEDKNFNYNFISVGDVFRFSMEGFPTNKPQKLDLEDFKRLKIDLWTKQDKMLELDTVLKHKSLQDSGKIDEVDTELINVFKSTIEDKELAGKSVSFNRIPMTHDAKLMRCIIIDDSKPNVFQASAGLAPEATETDDVLLAYDEDRDQWIIKTPFDATKRCELEDCYDLTSLTLDPVNFELTFLYSKDWKIQKHTIQIKPSSAILLLETLGCKNGIDENLIEQHNNIFARKKYPADVTTTAQTGGENKDILQITYTDDLGAQNTISLAVSLDHNDKNHLKIYALHSDGETASPVEVEYKTDGSARRLQISSPDGKFEDICFLLSQELDDVFATTWCTNGMDETKSLQSVMDKVNGKNFTQTQLKRITGLGEREKQLQDCQTIMSELQKFTQLDHNLIEQNDNQIVDNNKIGKTDFTPASDYCCGVRIVQNDTENKVGLQISDNCIVLPWTDSIDLHDIQSGTYNHFEVLDVKDICDEFRAASGYKSGTLNGEKIFEIISTIASIYSKQFGALAENFPPDKSLAKNLLEHMKNQKQLNSDNQRENISLDISNNNHQNAKNFVDITDSYCGVRIVRAKNGDYGLQINADHVAVPYNSQILLYSKNNGNFLHLREGLKPSEVGMNFPNTRNMSYFNGRYIGIIINTIAEIENKYPSSIKIGPNNWAPNEDLRNALLQNQQGIQQQNMNIMNEPLLGDNNNELKDNQKQDSTIQTVGSPCLGVQVVEFHNGPYNEYMGLQISDNEIVLPLSDRVAVFKKASNGGWTENYNTYPGVNEVLIPKKLKDATGWHLDTWLPDRFSDIIDAINNINGVKKQEIKKTMSDINIEKKLRDYMDKNQEEQNINNNPMVGDNKKIGQTNFVPLHKPCLGVGVVCTTDRKTFGLQINDNCIVVPLNDSMRLHDIKTGKCTTQKFLNVNEINNEFREVVGYFSGAKLVSNEIFKIISTIAKIADLNIGSLATFAPPSKALMKKLLQAMNNQHNINKQSLNNNKKFQNNQKQDVTLEHVGKPLFGVQVVEFHNGNHNGRMGLKISDNYIVIPQGDAVALWKKASNGNWIDDNRRHSKVNAVIIPKELKDATGYNFDEWQADRFSDIIDAINNINGVNKPKIKTETSDPLIEQKLKKWIDSHSKEQILDILQIKQFAQANGIKVLKLLIKNGEDINMRFGLQISDNKIAVPVTIRPKNEDRILIVNRGTKKQNIVQAIPREEMLSSCGLNSDGAFTDIAGIITAVIELDNAVADKIKPFSVNNTAVNQRANKAAMQIAALMQGGKLNPNNNNKNLLMINDSIQSNEPNNNSFFNDNNNEFQDNQIHINYTIGDVIAEAGGFKVVQFTDDNNGVERFGLQISDNYIVVPIYNEKRKCYEVHHVPLADHDINGDAYDILPHNLISEQFRIVIPDWKDDYTPNNVAAIINAVLEYQGSNKRCPDFGMEINDDQAFVLKRIQEYELKNVQYVNKISLDKLNDINNLDNSNMGAKLPGIQNNPEQNVTFQNVGKPLLGVQVVELQGGDHNGWMGLQIDNNTVAVPSNDDGIELLALQNGDPIATYKDIDETAVMQNIRTIVGWPVGKWNSDKICEIIDAINEINNTVEHRLMGERYNHDIAQKLRDYIDKNQNKQDINNMNLNESNNINNLSNENINEQSFDMMNNQHLNSNDQGENISLGGLGVNMNNLNAGNMNTELFGINDNQKQDVTFQNVGKPLLGVQVVELQCGKFNGRMGLKISDDEIIVPTGVNELVVFDANTGNKDNDYYDAITKTSMPNVLIDATGWHDNNWDVTKICKIINAINKINNSVAPMIGQYDPEIEKKLRDYIDKNQNKQDEYDNDLNESNNNNNNDKSNMNTEFFEINDSQEKNINDDVFGESNEEISDVTFKYETDECCGVKVVSVIEGKQCRYGLQIDNDRVVVPTCSRKAVSDQDSIDVYNIDNKQFIRTQKSMSQNFINTDLCTALKWNGPYDAQRICKIINAIATINNKYPNEINVGGQQCKPADDLVKKLQNYRKIDNNEIGEKKGFNLNKGNKTNVGYMNKFFKA